MSSAFIVLAWTAVIATLAFSGATERRLEQSCSTHAPTAEACRRM
jgi:hypothetical protein